MRNVSTKYLQAMENRRDFYPEAEITFLDGVKKTLDKNDFFIAGNSIIDSAESSSFPLGILVSKRITISIVNDDDRWADYSFTWAKIFLKTKFDLDDGTTETLNIGTFTVVTPETYGSTIQITAMDDCYKTDVEYSSDLPFPASAGVALQDSCTTCGITLKTLSFANDDFVISEKPENITHRQFIGMIAMLAGGNARMDEYNRLIIMSYDFGAFEQDGLDGGVFDDGTPRYESGDTASGGSFNPWDTGYVADGGHFGDRNNVHILYDYKSGIKIDADDVVITGVQMVDENKEVYLFGKDGYVLQLENRLAEGKESEAVQRIGQKIVGLTFRPFSGDHIAYPMAEFMDLAYIFDYKNNMYQTVLTDVNFTYNGFTSMKCAADSPVRNSSKYYGNEVKAIIEARKMVKDERTEREKALEVLANELAHSSGLYITPDVQPDGSTIYYMHNKSSLGESDIVWKLTAEAIGISTDGGKTYPVGVDATGMAILNRIYTIGLNADYITTGAFEIRKGDKVMVLMDKDTGQVILRPDTFELSSGETIDSIAEDKAAGALQDAKDYVDKEVNNFISETYDPKIAELQKQLDGQIESFYYDYEPALNKAPSNAWTTDTDKQKHEGDLFFWESKGYAYRFLKDGTTWKWQMVQDTDITKALANAATAQDTADHKRRVFVSTPTVPYDVGDLWVQGDKGDILRCQTAKSTSQSYSTNDWVKASKYTDDSALTAFIKGDFATLSAQADKKAETFYQVTDPSSGWSSDQKTEHIGDLWYNSTTTVQKYYRWDGKAWQELTSTPPDAVFDQIDGKAQIFIDTPKPPYHVGDLWFQSNTSDIMTCTKERLDGNYNSGDWQKRNKYISQSDANTAASNAVNAQTQQSIFNKLTNNGTEQGIYLKEGLLYLNAEYMATGILQSHDGETFYLDLDKGILRMKATELTISGQTVEDIAQSKASSAANTALASAKTYADNAAKNAVNGQTQQDIFNKLTGGGSSQGIFLQGGKLYLNAEYLSTGIVADKARKNFWNLDTGEFSLSSTVLEDAGNLLMDSEELSETYWTHSGNVSRGYTDPEGGNKAIMLTPTKTDSFFSANSNNNRPIKSTGQGYTFSVWLKASKTSTFTISLNHTYGTRKTITVGTAWKRYTISTEVSTISSSNQVTIGGWSSLTSTSGNIYIYKPVVQYGHSSEVAFGQLTNNGAVQGLYMSNGNLYMNASYVQTGILNVKKKDGTSTFYANMDTGEVNIVATSFSLTSGKTIDSIAEDKAKSAADSALSSAKTYADGAAGTAAKNAVNAQTQLDIFNKLTGGGTEQGIFLQDGKVYLNASYMSVSYLASISANLGTITAGVLQSNGYGYSYSSDPYSSAGMQINLNTNTVRAKNFAIDADGNAYFKGKLVGATGSFSGSLSAATGTFVGSLSAATGSFSGTLNAATGSFSGKIKATEGSIGGWTIGTDRIYRGGGLLESPNQGDLYFGVNGLGIANKFKVTNNGFLTSVSGTIAGWTINSNYFSNGGTRISTSNTSGAQQSIGYTHINGDSIQSDYIYCARRFTNAGTSNTSINTVNYSNRLLSAYEMSSPTLGDIGEGETDESGECYIYLDDVFSETVSADIEYQVFLQKEGSGDILVAEKNPQYFVVKGTENLKFSWEIKAKRKGYELTRLEQYDESGDGAAVINYEAEYDNEINELIEKREEMYYEAA